MDYTTPARLALGTSVFIAACSGAPEPIGERSAQVAASIINGTVDSDHPAVVSYFHDGAKCSATIVAVKGSTGYALTAGHCVGQNTGQLFQGQDSNNAVAIYNVIGLATHPSYPASTLYDFAMLKFAGATSQTPVLPLLSAADDKLASGAAIDLVGFGNTNDSGGQTSIRHHKTLNIKQVTALRLIYDQSGGGLCSGDSGGPGLYNSSGEHVAGVHSYVSSQSGGCLYEGTDVRVSAVVDTFIKPYIDGGSYGPQSCAQCTEAHAANGLCTKTVIACNDSPACTSYDGCIQACQTNACVVDCKNKFAQGAAIYQEFISCLCTTGCEDECSEAGFCNQPKCGLAMANSACQTCFEASCCAEAEACSLSNTCISCFSKLVPPPQCATDPTTVALKQCMADHCGSDCGAVSSSSSSSSAVSSGAATTVGATSSGSGSGGSATSSGSGGAPDKNGAEEPIVVGGCQTAPTASDGTMAFLVVTALFALTLIRSGLPRRPRAGRRRRTA